MTLVKYIEDALQRVGGGKAAIERLGFDYEEVKALVRELLTSARSLEPGNRPAAMTLHAKANRLFAAVNALADGQVRDLRQLLDDAEEG
jgi:hypothetical protein